MTHESRKEQRIVKWIDCSELTSRKGKSEKAEERGGRKVLRKGNAQKRERREKKERGEAAGSRGTLKY